MTDLALSEQELREITGYSRAQKQMQMLESLGIPAKRRRDNSVLVLRMHFIHPVTLTLNPEPKLKPIRK